MMAPPSESYVAAAADECEFASHSLRLAGLLLPPSLRISGPQQSAASRGEIKRNVRFDGDGGGGGVDVQREGGGGKIPCAMLEMRLRAMPCHPYLMAQFMVQVGSGQEGNDWL